MLETFVNLKLETVHKRLKNVSLCLCERERDREKEREGGAL